MSSLGSRYVLALGLLLSLSLPYNSAFAPTHNAISSSRLTLYSPGSNNINKSRSLGLDVNFSSLQMSASSSSTAEETEEDYDQEAGNDEDSHGIHVIKDKDDHLYVFLFLLSTFTLNTVNCFLSLKKKLTYLSRSLVTYHIHLCDAIIQFKRKFLAENPDQITIIKFYAPWCRACKGLEPKYVQISQDPKYANLPLKFCQMSVQNNKDYIKSLGILALPSVLIYGGAEEGLVENFPCGPSKVPILKKKIAQVVNNRVDASTMKLKPFKADEEKEAEACVERTISSTTAGQTQVRVGDVVVSQDTLAYLRNEIPYFKDLSDEEFETLMAKAKYSTFEAGSVIMRQGKPGRTFYVIDDGEVEISVKGAFEDPLTTPSGYLGTVVNRLTKQNYFGERSLITGQPRAASIRANEKTRCFTFDIEDIPESSVLSGKRRATQERLNQINDKYALDYYDITLIDKQFQDVATANQVKGSPNGPSRDKEKEKEVAGNDYILSLLMRFKLLRQAAKCFEYILQTSPTWGDQGEAYRRSLLVKKLTASQQKEFKEVFKMIDSSHDGRISVLELKNALESIYDEQQSDDKVKEMINKANPIVDGNTEITLDEFMGVMAEAEFYYLFKETFAALDKNMTGYVPAYKLDKVLCGLRDLISDDRKSIIDVEDKEMMVDYETFSRMMIGSL